MRNRFDHQRFNQFIDSKSGKAYFMGIKRMQMKGPEGENDYILPLAKKHQNKSLKENIMYWQRKNKPSSREGSNVDPRKIINHQRMKQKRASSNNSDL